MRFIRYVVAERDSTSGHRRGFIRSAWYLEEAGTFSANESARIEQLFEWFNENLPQPTRMSRTRNEGHKEKLALSWFKDCAQLHLEHAREMVEIMRANDVVVEMVTTDRPGFVVYEDDFQVIAVPFADTQT